MSMICIDRTKDVHLTSFQMKNEKNEKMKFKLGEITTAYANKLLFAAQIEVKCDDFDGMSLFVF